MNLLVAPVGQKVPAGSRRIPITGSIRSQGATPPALGYDHDHSHAPGKDHGHDHSHSQSNGHTHSHQDETTHRHGRFGRAHSHGPLPGADGKPVSIRDLILLGVSGGLLPCPSALVVLLSAIAFHRLAFGMVLIVAFSMGLATVLTGIGIGVVYAGRFAGRLQSGGTGAWLNTARRASRVVPIFSAFAVACLGFLIALGAISPGSLPAIFSRL